MAPAFLMIIVIILAGANSQIRTSTSIGAYFQKLNKIHAYEKTIPIVYALNTPPQFDEKELKMEIQKLTEGNEIPDQKAKNVKNSINQLLEMIGTIEKINTETIKEFDFLGKTRDKRGIQFMGDFTHWCCNVLTEREGDEFHKQESDLKGNYAKLRELVLDKHSEILNLTTEMKIFSEDTGRNVGLLRNSIINIVKEMENLKDNKAKEHMESALTHAQNHFNTAITTHNRLLYLYQACKNHFLPSAFIEKEKLLKDLNKLKWIANKNGYDLTFDMYENIQNYYHSKLINCYHTENQIEVELKVPLKSLDTDYEAFDYKSINFKTHDGKICRWDQNPMIILKDRRSDKIKIIEGTDLERCNKKENLCYAPQNRIESSLSSCARVMLLQKSYDEIRANCIFKCENNNGRTIIQQVDDEAFAIINAKSPLTVSNKANNTNEIIKIDESWPGALLLTVPCAFEIKHKINEHENETLIPMGLPCLKNSNKFKIEHHVPVTWTKINFMEVDMGVKQSVHFTNISLLYDENWQYKIPHFMPIKSVREIEKELETPATPWYYDINKLVVQATDSPCMSIVGIWSIVLTFLVIKLYFSVYLIRERQKTDAQIRARTG